MRGGLLAQAGFRPFGEQAGCRGLRDELAGVEDFQGDRLVVLGEVDDHRAEFLGVVDGPFRHFNQKHVHLWIIGHAQTHSDSSWLDRT